MSASWLSAGGFSVGGAAPADRGSPVPWALLPHHALLLCLLFLARPAAWQHGSPLCLRPGLMLQQWTPRGRCSPWSERRCNCCWALVATLIITVKTVLWWLNLSHSRSCPYCKYSQIIFFAIWLHGFESSHNCNKEPKTCFPKKITQFVWCVNLRSKICPSVLNSTRLKS